MEFVIGHLNVTNYTQCTTIEDLSSHGLIKISLKVSVQS